MKKPFHNPDTENAIKAMGFDPVDIVPIDPQLIARMNALLADDQTKLDLDAPLSSDDE